MDISESELKQIVEQAYLEGLHGHSQFCSEYASGIVDFVSDSKRKSSVSGYILTATSGISVSANESFQNNSPVYYSQGVGAFNFTASGNNPI